MAFFGPVFWVIILLGVMILVHELGHFWAALSVGVRVETFSIGFGPRLFGFKRRDTDFRISAVPFGGYVRMLGEQPGDETAADPRSFQAKARWQRAIVIIAGPLMNVILAIAVVAGLYMYGFPKEVPSADAVVSSVAPNSAAAAAGIEPGDRIVQIGSKHDPSWQDVLTQEALNANHALRVVVDRTPPATADEAQRRQKLGDRYGTEIAAGKQQRLTFFVTPRMDPKEGIGVAGWRGDVQVGEVAKGAPADAAGLKPGDALISVNHEPIESFATVQQAIIKSCGRPVELELMRNNQLQDISVTPAPGNNPKLPCQIGIAFRMPVKMVKLDFGPAITESLRFNRQNATMIFQVLGQHCGTACFSEDAGRADRDVADGERSRTRRAVQFSRPDGNREFESGNLQFASYSDPGWRNAAAADY